MIKSRLSENRDIELRQIAMVTDLETGSLLFRFNELVYHYCEYDSRNTNVDLVIISWLQLNNELVFSDFEFASQNKKTIFRNNQLASR